MMAYLSKAKEELRDLEENLQQLTVDILDITIDEVPRNYQRHTIGVSRWFSILLRRVSQAIACYHEH